MGDNLAIEHHFTTTIYMRKSLLSDESLVDIELHETVDVVDNELVLPRPQDKFIFEIINQGNSGQQVS